MVALLGTDSEFFVETDSGEIGSSIGLIGGSKSSPYFVEKGNLQEDNVLAEIAINPAASKQEWVDNISSLRLALDEKLSERGHRAVLQASHVYTKQQLTSYPPIALELGCEPDYNVYKQQENKRPNAFQGLRTAAGHIHFSLEMPTEGNVSDVIKCMDYLLGVWSVIHDPDTRRRAMYGKAGSVRFKAYGGEYRTLSNFWLGSQEMQEYVYDVSQIAVQHAAEMLPRLRAILPEARLTSLIDNSSRAEAQLLYPHIAEVMAQYELS